MVVAQTDEEPVTFVTGTLPSQSTDHTEEEWSTDGTVGHARGFKVIETMEWSDPRLPTDKVTIMNFDMHDIGQLRNMAFTAATVLEGPDGYWTGSGSGFLDPDGVYRGVEVLTGHGAYDGLSATITFTDLEGSEPGTVDGAEGFIFAGEMPPMPEPLEPSTQ